MRKFKASKKAAKRFLAGILVLVLTALSYRGLFPPVYGANLGARSLGLSTSDVGASATYDLTFALGSNQTLGSIVVTFCSNSPLVNDSCTFPVGFTDSKATIVAQSGVSGFSISSSSTSNSLIFTRNPSAVNAGTVINIQFKNVVNPSSPGSYYARVYTYASTDGSGSYTDFGGLSMSYITALTISAEVPPYLLFCTGVTIPKYNCQDASGDFINFGTLSPATTSYGTSQMLAATNARTGYAITVYGTTLESGVNTIPGISSPDVSRPGTAQFGLNLMANSSPSVGSNPTGPGSGTASTGYNQPNFFNFTSDSLVASAPKPDLDRLYTVSYMVNVPQTQAPGIYVTTLTYICVGTF